jgi:ABC-type lipoprotein release transport system permease subunit
MPEGLSVRGWEAYAEDYLAAAAGDNISTRIMIVFLFVLSFIGIANTMLMAVLERTKEIGMMRALGMTDGQLLLSYAIEAGMIGLLGSLAGVALGCLINVPMVEYGVDFSSMSKEMGGDFGYRVAALFRSAWNPATIAATAVAATLLSALMALPPTLRALRLPVTESLRFE